MKKAVIVKIMSVTLVIAIGVFFFTINSKSDEATKGETVKKEKIPTYEIRSTYTVDVDNPEEVVGSVDYVFVGKVLEETGTSYKNKVPVEVDSDTIEYIGDAYTNYKVKVISNIKNELVTDNVIEIAKLGGIREDKSAYDVFEDDELPVQGETYIFTAFTQDDGSLLVSGANSNIRFDEKPSKVNTEKAVASTEEYQEYQEAVDNQIEPVGKEELKSIYDATE
ncbi:cell surface protein [Listeria booriae]|uniref:cell surface protein n=1 Tax=Listeria booriae TaxID=1552123 RepID=UPI0016267EF1|nr:cell surface protein [Listeria booriae]MBC2100646.1 cell surface protein [Listeria booriae]